MEPNVEVKTELEQGEEIILMPMEQQCSEPRLLPPPPPPRKRRYMNFKKPPNIDKKTVAQELYYSTPSINLHQRQSVHERIGGPVYRRRARGRYVFPQNNNWISYGKRIKKDGDQLYTYKWLQRAQQRILYLRNKLHQSRMQVQFNNTYAPKYPDIYHSIQRSINKEIQLEIKLVQEQTTDTQVIDPDELLAVEDTTSMTLNQRFNTYL